MTPKQRAKHALHDDWQNAYVEEKISGLVRALNRKSLGIRTIAACEGHLKGPASPYVYFQCSVELAALIDQTLRSIWAEKRGLTYIWTLSGGFNSKHELGFTIRAPRLQRAHIYPWPPVYVFWIVRSKIDADLALLAEKLDDMINDLRNVSELNIPKNDS